MISQITFSVIRTFIYAILAQAAFLLFPMNLFGMIYGTLQLCNGLVSLTADPIFRLKTKTHFILDGWKSEFFAAFPIFITIFTNQLNWNSSKLTIFLVLLSLLQAILYYGSNHLLIWWLITIKTKMGFLYLASALMKRFILRKLLCYDILYWVNLPKP